MTDAQAETVIERLTEIRNLLAMAVMAPASTEPASCEHPADQRMDLSTLRREGFHCRACGFRRVVDRETGEPIDI